MEDYPNLVREERGGGKNCAVKDRPIPSKERVGERVGEYLVGPCRT